MGVYQIEEWKPVVGYEGLYEVSNTGRVHSTLYESALDAQRITGINASHIGECCKYKRYKSVGGYVWRFEGSDDLLVKQ